jgi:hypothetical protein
MIQIVASLIQMLVVMLLDSLTMHAKPYPVPPHSQTREEVAQGG